MRRLKSFFATVSFSFLILLPSYAGSLNSYEPPPMFGAALSAPVNVPHNTLNKLPKLFDDNTLEPSGFANIPLPPKRPKTFYASASFVREMRKTSASTVPVERVYAEPLSDQPLDRVDGAHLRDTSAQDIWSQIQ